MSQNIINNNRFFSKTIQSFFNNYNLEQNKIYCDIDSLYQYPNYKKCYKINHIENHNIFGDKFTHYNLLMQNNKNSKYLLETYLFNSNPNTHIKIKKILKKYPIWIIKPRNDYGRKGITIVRNYDDIINWIQNEKPQEWILQKYIDNPLLMNNKKFHIRIYVILNKINKNIQFYIYKKGFIYTAGNDYNLHSYDLSSHLSGEDNPSRVSVFEENHILFPRIWNQIKELVNKCIVPIQPYIKCPNINEQCYKFLGLDILIDRDYNLYLAEINSRLISLKYPPKNFKENMYLDILNTIYHNKPKMLELVSTNQIEYFQSNKQVKKYKKQNILLICLIATFFITTLVILLILLKKK